MFFNSFFTKISLWCISFPIRVSLEFRKLFLSLEIFIMALWSSVVINGASLARTYFLLIGACLLKIRDTVFLNPSRSLPLKFISKYQTRTFLCQKFYSLFNSLFSVAYFGSSFSIRWLSVCQSQKILFQKPYYIENNLVDKINPCRLNRILKTCWFFN